MADTSDTDLAAAFGQGSDARLQGTPRYECPYSGGCSGTLQSRLSVYWLRGWDHVHYYWGKSNRRRVVRPLPAAAVA
jgi:hypothetical protein